MRPRLAAAALLLAACRFEPEAYPPPIQRGEPALATRPYRHFIAMNDPDAARYFVRDVSPALENGVWRWSGERPTFRFVLRRVEGLRFTMDFSIAGAVLDETGPQTVSIFVNGRLLGRARYAEHGEQRFEKAVDPSWLKAGEDTIVTAQIEPVWVSPDGNKLGVILLRAGFVD
jgi:hypothetical protein